MSSPIFILFLVLEGLFLFGVGVAAIVQSPAAGLGLIAMSAIICAAFLYVRAAKK